MAETRINRKLAAILVADVVGYSRLMGANEAGTLAALKKFRETIFDPAVTAHNGRIVKLIGDGTVVEFGSVVDAVTCALAVQRSRLSSPDTVARQSIIVVRMASISAMSSLKTTTSMAMASTSRRDWNLCRSLAESASRRSFTKASVIGSTFVFKMVATSASRT